MLEIIGSVVLCILTSLLALYLARRSLIPTDITVSRDDVKIKNKATKKSSKVKVAKKETGAISMTKEEDEIKTDVSKKTVKKEKKKKTEVSENIPTPTERVRVDSSDDWKKVSKVARKVSKKENKADSKEGTISESIELDIPVIISPSVVEPIVAVEKPAKNTKSKKSTKSEAVKADVKQCDEPKETIKEVKEPEIKGKQQKETVAVNESKVFISEDNELRQRVGELMSDLDRQKTSNREESKSHTQAINQLNKELDVLKQKMKISQLNEEKLTEELKKKNTSFNDIKQQFVIVQSELTKNIVQAQAINREKDKLENRLKSLDESNKQLIEKSEMFDRVNAEKENLLHRLAAVEEEYKTASNRFNEMSKAKEVEYCEKINQLQMDRQRMQEQLVRVQTDLIENNSKLQNMQQELLNTKNTYTDLLNERNNLQKNYVSLENANMVFKQQQTSELNDRDRETKERMTEVMHEIDHLKTINGKLTEENEDLKKQCHDAASNQISDDSLHAKLSSLAEELNNANQLLQESNKDSGLKKESFDKLVAEINELKSEKEKLLTSLEHYKTELENTELTVRNLQNSFTEDETKWKESLEKLEKEATKKEESLKQEINRINALLLQSENESECRKEAYDTLVVENNELRTEKDNMSSLVEQYKSGLENTESILSKLQISVNEEETKWRESLLKSESEAEKCSKELETVYNELMRIRNQRTEKNELNFAYHCVDKSLSSLIDEMEARMNHFETSLEAVIQERDSALAQVHVQINGTATESEATRHTAVVNGDDCCDSEMTKIKEDLLNQVELNKSLETHCNKYKALIDIGKDALEAEKVQVQTLKEELKVLQSKLSANSNESL